MQYDDPKAFIAKLPKLIRDLMDDPDLRRTHQCGDMIVMRTGTGGFILSKAAMLALLRDPGYSNQPDKLVLNLARSELREILAWGGVALDEGIMCPEGVALHDRLAAIFDPKPEPPVSQLAMARMMFGKD